MASSIVAAAVGLSPIGWAVAVISGLAFLSMFILVSIKGDYQGVIASTLTKPSSKNEK